MMMRKSKRGGLCNKYNSAIINRKIHLIGYSRFFVLFILDIILDFVGINRRVFDIQQPIDWHSNLCFGYSIARCVLAIMCSV